MINKHQKKHTLYVKSIWEGNKASVKVTQLSKSADQIVCEGESVAEPRVKVVDFLLIMALT